MTQGDREFHTWALETYGCAKCADLALECRQQARQIERLEELARLQEELEQTQAKRLAIAQRQAVIAIRDAAADLDCKAARLEAKV